MINLLPCKFRFDAFLEYDIPKTHLDFYIELSKEIFQQDFILPADITFKAISIEDFEVEKNPSVVSNLFKSKLETDYSGFINSLEQNTFIIDLSRSSKGSKLLFPLINDQLLPILKVLTINKQEFIQPVFFILLETLYPPEKFYEETDEIVYAPESYYVLLEDFIFNGSVCVMGFNNNQGYYSWKKKTFQKISDFYSKTTKLKQNALELMNYKLIKKIGHFARKPGDEACQQFFYNGEFCENEIFELLNETILNMFKTDLFNPKYIVLHCPQSPWLKESIIRSSNELLRLKSTKKFKELSIQGCFDINEFEKNPIETDKIKDEQCDVLFVVDFIHSGIEFKKEFIDRVRPYFPKSEIRGLTLLCTNTAVRDHKSDSDEKTINLYISDENINIPIRYIQNVEHKVYEKADEEEKCPMCKYKLLPRVNSDGNIGLKLTSYEMWLIANSSGYEEEPVRSTIKRELHWVPKIMEIIEEYGPYLAFKFNQNLKRSFPNDNERPKIVVFPDETTNIYYKDKLGKDQLDLKDTPSGFYAKCLEELLRIEIFGIPREVIHALKGEGNWVDNKIRLEDIPLKFPKIHHQIERLGNNFIVIDEFYSTGNTFEMILAILKKFGKTPRCYFPILNYGLKNMNEKIQSGEYKGFKILNLYEFNIN